MSGEMTKVSPSEHSIKIKLHGIFDSRNSVVIDGIELASYVRKIDVMADAGDLPMVVLEIPVTQVMEFEAVAARIGIKMPTENR